MGDKDGVKQTIKSVKKLTLVPLILIVLGCIILFALIVKLEDLDTVTKKSVSKKVQSKIQSMYNTSSISAKSDGTNRKI